MTPVIVIEGPIAAGKTTLVKHLSERLNLTPRYEPVESNPYLDLFYEDPKRWAFAMQIHLLHWRYASQKEAAYAAAAGRGSIFDRSMPGDRVFCRMHMEAGNIAEIEWQTYQMAYQVMSCSLVPPSLLIYLDVDPEIALERLRRRGRECEAGVTLEYLQALTAGYGRMLHEVQHEAHPWARGMKVLRVDYNNMKPDGIDALVREALEVRT